MTSDKPAHWKDVLKRRLALTEPGEILDLFKGASLFTEFSEYIQLNMSRQRTQGGVCSNVLYLYIQTV